MWSRKGVYWAAGRWLWSDSIPPYSRELRDLVTYRKIAWNFAYQGWNWQELDSTGESSGFKDDLEALATADSTAGAMYARNVLSLLNDSIYPLIYLFADDTSSSSKRDHDKLLATAPPDGHSALANLKVYPNPVNNQLKVEYRFESGQIGPVRFVVYNSMGQFVLEEVLDPGATLATINMSGLGNGFYFYSITCADCSDLSGKFIILR